MMVAAIASAPGGVSASTPTFCARMAPQLGMKPVVPNRRPGPTGEWRVNTLKGIGPVLFGGTAATSISVRPVGGAPSAADDAWMEKACLSTRKGAVCRIEGPARVKIGARTGSADVEAAADERAEVEVQNTVILCRDTVSAARG